MNNELATYSASWLEQAVAAIDALTITDLASEAQAADFYAKVELTLRDIEAKRLEITAPLNTALKVRNKEAKEASAPLETLKEAIATKMGEYMASPALRALIEKRQEAEAAFQQAERSADIGQIAEASTALQALLAERPKTIETSTEANVQYRTDIVIDEMVNVPSILCEKSIDTKALLEAVEMGEVSLSEKFIVLAPDTKAIKNAIKNGEVVSGVKWHYKVTPVAVVRQ